MSVWEPGRPFVVTCFGECPRGCDESLATITLRIEPRGGMTIDEHITAAGAEHSGPAEVARASEAIPVVKIVLNLCLFGVERGVRDLQLDARAEKWRRRARSDGRMARLAARDVQEVVIRDRTST